MERAALEQEVGRVSTRGAEGTRVADGQRAALDGGYAGVGVDAVEGQRPGPTRVKAAGWLSGIAQDAAQGQTAAAGHRDDRIADSHLNVGIHDVVARKHLDLRIRRERGFSVIASIRPRRNRVRGSPEQHRTERYGHVQRDGVGLGRRNAVTLSSNQALAVVPLGTTEAAPPFPPIGTLLQLERYRPSNRVGRTGRLTKA